MSEVVLGKEDITMDKNRQSVQTKSTSDNNGSIQKQSQNSGRRRSGRNEPQQRSKQPAKPRVFDKRPGRGNDRQYPGHWEREEVNGDGVAELGSAQRPASKKGNLNHLLNFTFTPRDGDMSARGGGGNSWQGNGGSRRPWPGKATLKFNKERFLQANCQFIVRENADYMQYVADPDTLVEWSLVEQVRLRSSEVPSCPICLYPPTAAKITRCGHVYCWTCILHYLSLGEKSWSKCPICYESIHSKDLRSVVALATQQYAAGDRIRMTLMKRDRGSTYAMPRTQWTLRDGKPHNMDDDVDAVYLKLLLASPHQVRNILEQEHTALQCQLAQDGLEGSLEASIIQAAITEVETKLQQIGVQQETKEEIAVALSKLEIEDIDVEKDKEVTLASPIEKGVTYGDAFDELLEESVESAVDVTGSSSLDEECEPVSSSPEPLVSADGDSPTQNDDIEEATDALMMPLEEEPNTATAAGDAKPEKNVMTTTYYYYQAADGQQIYLHSVNARCLLKQFGSWEACPDTLAADIVELEHVSMDAELRRRLRYLSHLPLSCEFHVAEVQLGVPVISEDVLEFYQKEIEKRRQARQRKSRDDRRFDKKMQHAEDLRNGKQRGLNCNISSQQHFPEAGELAMGNSSRLDDDVNSTASSPMNTPFGSPGPTSMLASMLNPNASEFCPGSPQSGPQSPASTSSLCSQGEDGGQAGSNVTSFAQMLRAGHSSQSVGRRAAWGATGSKVPASAQAVYRHLGGNDSEEDSEDRVPVPDYKSSIGDAIQHAIEQYDKTPVKEPEKGGKKKKKKQKGMLLFSTG